MRNIGIVMALAIIGCLFASCATTQEQSGLSQDKIAYQAPFAGTPEEVFRRSQIWVAETLQTREPWGEGHGDSIRYADGASGVIVARHTISRRRLWEQDSFTFTITIDTQSGSLVFSNFSGEFGKPLPAKSLDKARAELDALANAYIAAVG